MKLYDRYGCGTCGWLNKGVRFESENGHCYMYGCRKNGGYMCHWIEKDSELNTGGCSNWCSEIPAGETVIQLELF